MGGLITKKIARLNRPKTDQKKKIKDFYLILLILKYSS